MKILVVGASGYLGGRIAEYLSVAGNEIFTATLTGPTGLAQASIANDTTTSTFTLPTLTVALNVVTVAFTLPNGTQGDQTLTLTITDSENGDVGTAKLTILNDGT